MNNIQKIEISTWTIVKFFLFILGLIFLYYIRNVAALFFIVLILVAGFTPFVNNMTKSKIPRFLSVVIVYLAILIFLSFIIYLVIPPLIEQMSLISSSLSTYSRELQQTSAGLSEFVFQGKDAVVVIKEYLSHINGGLTNSFLSIFGSATSALAVFALTFYILIEHDSIEKFILNFFPIDSQKKGVRIYAQISNKLGDWLRGRILLSVIISAVVYVIFFLFGNKYALSLAVLAGVLDIVPIIGPIIAGVLIISANLAIGAPLWVVVVITALFVGLQFVEAQYLVPKMMGKIVGLSPVVIILALMIGAQLGGVMGAVLAIPIAAGASVFIQGWSNKDHIHK